MRKVVLVVLSLVLISLVIFFLTHNSAVTAPDRVSNIPKEARWIGGSDGGNWFEIVQTLEEGKFRIKIYNENTGETEEDATFVLNQDCEATSLDASTLLNNIESYDGTRIILAIPKDGYRCSLNPIKQ